ncbi:unnamed protein product [Aphanomyces euteiches]|uniref:Coatomer subunit zeta n=1 Tax=Aphanomyces euteiches TaxID=100861 RepID=A0A6G0X601_9STRA|nr:hypothetical protein Ae201684_008110 [Aphanomyces euteiches]KAH9074444.1 hypothetical protein Ae201684P_022251 [Aphanomyces euteiches]KAH9107821.1 hypothetical protein LEN26_014241 [Aphanomyces euteiches]KAH9114619.1 hypothetical protein AeMF1_011306 [Aphanomyces euteiches]KAH9146016.1 hypothetical protein AeRB84_010074 [Aphanomyces euteiches]
MLHSALVTTDKANVLLARYFTPLTTEAKRVFEQALFKAVFSSAVSEHEAHLVVCDGQYVVYRKFGDLIWFLAGSGEYDELVCHDILMTLLSVANVHLEKKCTEATFLANHAKILVCLDELVFHGHLDNNDVASILQMTKLKPYPLKAA